MTAPAGWYQDPSVPWQVRYWDGVQWSTHTAPAQGQPGGFAPAASAEDMGPSNALHYLIPVGRSWQSIWAPYLGLFSLLSLPVIGHVFGAGGIVLGILALKRARTGGHGTGRAITGIVLGGIGFLTSSIFLIGIIASSGQQT